MREAAQWRRLQGLLFHAKIKDVCLCGDGGMGLCLPTQISSFPFESLEILSSNKKGKVETEKRQK